METINKDNPWQTVPEPLSDILLHDIAPKYLTVKDLIHLSMVSRRYHELLGISSAPSSSLSSSRGNQVLAKILRLEQQQQHGRVVSYRDQLPTIGNLSEEESLEFDPVFVAKLRKAALRRRRLITLQYNNIDGNVDVGTDNHQHQNGVDANNDLLQMQLQEIVTQFRCKRHQEMMQDLQQRRQEMMQNLRRRGLVESFVARFGLFTKFLCVNHSGRDVHCHWIDYHSQIVVRQGDRIPSSAQEEEEEEDTFQVAFNSQQQSPAHIFCHASAPSHTFALCWSEGGPPFAIYQQRRCWTGLPFPTHALQVLPGGRVQEVGCTFLAEQDVFVHRFWDRATGLPLLRLRDAHVLVPVPVGSGNNINVNENNYNSATTERYLAHERVPTTVFAIRRHPHFEGLRIVEPADTATTTTVHDNGTTNDSHEHRNAKVLAKWYYGTYVPLITDFSTRDELWRMEERFFELASNNPGFSQSVAINPVGETLSM